ncbi:MAG TPA: ATP-binding protein [Anaerolineales bacterium]|nr:ATP-binding protein [Anaerolineales bacterium]
MTTFSTPAPSTTQPAPGPGDPNCPICHGIGYVRAEVEITHPNFGRLMPCSCRQVEIEQHQKNHLTEISSLGPLAAKTFETFLPEGRAENEAHRRSLRLAWDVTRAYADAPKGWLLLHGGYGCGKTHLAAAIGNRRLAHGQPVLFVNAPDLLDHLRATFGPGSEVSYDDLFERVRNAPLLIIDDLGAESPTQWAQEKFYQIFNHRTVAALPTVITTNMPLERIEPRVRSRLVDGELVRKIVIDAPDYRGADHVGIQLSSLGNHRHQTFESFQDRKGGEMMSKEDYQSLVNALDEARKFAESPADWLIMFGPHGCGKTHLAAAIANHCDRRGDPVMFLTCGDLLDHLRATFSPDSAVRYDVVFNTIKTAPLLILDDLTLASATPWSRDKLYQLVDYRYAARLPTVITTPLLRATEEKRNTELRENLMDERFEARFLDEAISKRCSISAPMYRGGPSAKRKQRGKTR